MKTWLKENWFIGCMIFVFAFAAAGQITLAHPGRTDSSGCHTCRTNCPSWGLSYGEYHCHRAKALPQPKEPIKSTFGPGGTGTTQPAPEYKQSAPAPVPFSTTTSSAMPQKRGFWQWLFGLFK